MPHLSPETYRLITTAIVIAIVLAIRARSIGRERRLRLETLWIFPAIYAAIMAVVFWKSPPHGSQWAWIVAAMAAGAALGWRRGSMMRISVDPATHTLNQTNSWAAFAIIAAIVIVRQALSYEARSWHFDVLLLTDLLMALALGMFAATRAEMFLRARRLLAMARAA